MKEDQNNKIFNKTRIRFDEMFRDSLNFLEKTYGNVGNYFTSASPFGQLLTVITNMAQLIFYYIEDSITELNILTASRAESVRGLAALVGHDVTRPISASGDIRLVYNGKTVDIYGNSLIIPNFTTIKNKTNNLTYTIFLSSDAVSLELTDRNHIDVKIYQGTIETQSFAGNGEVLQSFNAAVRGGKHIDNQEVNVYVNNDKWTIYKSLYDIPRNGKGCIVKTSVSTGIDIFFGNGNFGEVPELGSNIRVEYLLTVGAQGNINTLDTDMEWEFVDDGLDLLGESVDINNLVNVKMIKEISFGTNFEDLDLTRLIAPKTSRSFVLANPENYVIFLEKFNFFGIIDAFSTFDDEYIDDDNVIYLFLIPDINRRITGSDNYFTTPITMFTLTDDEKERIIGVIEESGQKMITAVNTIVDPEIKRYVLNISLITFEGYSKDMIKQQIINKMSQYFVSFRRRDRIPKSDLIAIIEDIDGVDSVNLWFTSESREAILKNDPNGDEEKPSIDEFGDIIIGRGELPIIRGDWTDRNGIYYQDSTNLEIPSSINVSVKKTVPKTYNSEKHRINIENLR